MKPDWVKEADEREELHMFAGWLAAQKKTNPDLYRYLKEEE